MNTFRTVSGVLVAAAVVLTGNACAMDGFNKYRSNLQNESYRIVNNNKHAVASSFVADRLCDKDADAEKAFIETFGHLLDKSKNGKLNDIDREDGVHFVANYGIRKATRVLNRNGVTLKSTGDACKAAIKKVDILPTEGILRDGVNATADYVVKPVVSTVAEQVTKPETLTLIALPYVMQFVAGMLGQK